VRVVLKTVDLVKLVLAENMKIRFGIFGLIEDSGFFPPRPFLNEFLMVGYDPCDQDARMANWSPVFLSDAEYVTIKSWWVADHPGAVEDSLGVTCWGDWVEKILDQD
jgi:hypothetical protein